MADGRRQLVVWRTAAILLGSLSLVLLAVLLRPRDRQPQPTVELVAPTPTPTALPPRLRLEPAAFAELDGWSADDLEGFAQAFSRSCEVLARRGAQRPLAEPSPAGRVGDWSALCAAVDAAAPGELRAALERLTVPWRMRNNDDATASAQQPTP